MENSLGSHLAQLLPQLLPLILRSALFASLAILLLLFVRTQLRRRLGAALAYQAWLLVPIVTVAALLPLRSAPQLLSIPALAPVQALAAQAAPAASPQQADGLLLAWICGALALALRFVLGHRSYLAQAGRLVRAGEVYVGAAGVGPASVGLLRPRIVVPPDFAQRYSPAEQALVIAHERVHVARRDALANLAAALFQCAFWFDPLVHYAARCLRQDQELACDAAVMRRHPGQRRAYAEALLKSHTGALASAGLHCHWQTTHPTKERIMQLQHTPPGTVRRLAGRCILTLLAAGAFGATLGARAEQAASTVGPRYAVDLAMATASAPDIAFTLKADAFVRQPGKQGIPRILAAAGEQFAVTSGEWRVEMTVRPGDAPDQVWLAGKLFKGTNLVSEPKLLTRVGEPATVKVGDGGSKDFSVAMTVTPQP